MKILIANLANCEFKDRKFEYCFVYFIYSPERVFRTRIYHNSMLNWHKIYLDIKLHLFFYSIQNLNYRYISEISLWTKRENSEKPRKEPRNGRTWLKVLKSSQKFWTNQKAGKLYHSSSFIPAGHCSLGTCLGMVSFTFFTNSSFSRQFLQTSPQSTRIFFSSLTLIFLKLIAE